MLARDTLPISTRLRPSSGLGGSSQVDNDMLFPLTETSWLGAMPEQTQ